MTIIQQTMDFYPRQKVVQIKHTPQKSNNPQDNKLQPSLAKHTGGNISISAFCSQLAKKGVKMGRNGMFKWLRDNGYLSRQKSTWNMPLQKFIGQGILDYKETFVFVADEQVPKYSPLITAQGRAYFIDKLTSLDTPQKKSNRRKLS